MMKVISSRQQKSSLRKEEGRYRQEGKEKEKDRS